MTVSSIQGIENMQAEADYEPEWFVSDTLDYKARVSDVLATPYKLPDDYELWYAEVFPNKNNIEMTQFSLHWYRIYNKASQRCVFDSSPGTRSAVENKTVEAIKEQQQISRLGKKEAG